MLSALLVVLLIFAISIAYREARKDIFSPLVIAMFMISFFYILDAIYLISHSHLESGFWLSGLYFSYDDSVFIELVVVLYVAMLAWIMGDFLGRYFAGRSLSGIRVRVEFSGVMVSQFIIWVTYFSVISVGLMLVYQIQSVVGFSVYIADMASRSLVFESFTMQNALLHVVLIYAAFLSSYIFFVQCRLTQGAGLLILCIFVAFFTGGRAIVLMMLLIWIMQYNNIVKRIRLDFKYVVIFVVLTLMLPYVALLTRTSSEYYEGDLFANIFNTGQVPQANNIFLLAQYELSGYLSGSSLWNDIFSFVPGFLFNMVGLEKQLGGNTDFTIMFWPDRWDAYKSQISIGGIGEVYFNFGSFGVFFFYLMVSTVYRFLYLILPIKFGYVIGGMLIVPLYWSIFQQFRGDYFHTINKLFLFYVAVFAVIMTFQRSRRLH